MLFEKIMKVHDEKHITRLCKKLSKSCSFTKNSDVTSLCELAYWLYVFNDKENALRACECTNIDIPTKINYNVWDFILWIWGLEAYIYGEYGRTDDKNIRISQMKKVWSTPNRSDKTEEEMWKSYQKIANRQTFQGLCNMEKIAEEADIENKKSENTYRFSALYNMIGYGVTGFYPALEENKDELERKIEEYIMCLRLNPSL